jgi:hypothetical protein
LVSFPFESEFLDESKEEWESCEEDRHSSTVRDVAMSFENKFLVKSKEE